MIARVLPYIGKESEGSDEKDAVVVSNAVQKLVEGLGHKTTLTEYKVPAGEEESVALHALVGGKDHPDFEHCEFQFHGKDRFRGANVV